MLLLILKLELQLSATKVCADYYYFILIECTPLPKNIINET